MPDRSGSRPGNQGPRAERAVLRSVGVPVTPRLRLTLLGVGAMNSPRYPPAGLLVRYRRRQVMLDGGPGAEPAGPLAAWLVSDERSELRRELRALCAARGLHPAVEAVCVADLVIEPRPVVHTSHPTWGYLLRLPTVSAVWAPDLGLSGLGGRGGPDVRRRGGLERAIRFARGAGGHMAALHAAEQAREHRVARLVFAHIGRPSLRAIDAGCRLPFGEWGEPGRTYQLPPQTHGAARHSR